MPREAWHEPTVANASSENVQAQIGMQLRAVYETMIAQPIPDRFVELLERLERERANPKSGPERGEGSTGEEPGDIAGKP